MKLGADQLGAGGSCWQCCTSGLNTVRNAAVYGASSETSSCSRSGGDMSSVRIGYGADWKAGVWPGCHAHCGNLARVEKIWVMVTDSTVDSDGTSELAVSDTAQPQPQTAG